MTLPQTTAMALGCVLIGCAVVMLISAWRLRAFPEVAGVDARVGRWALGLGAVLLGAAVLVGR